MRREPAARNQSGMALAISMILLFVLTIIGVTAMQSTTMEERMAGNLASRSTAFQRAEGTLTEAKDFLGAPLNMSSFTAAGTNGLYAFSANPDYQASGTWVASKTKAAADQPNSLWFAKIETDQPVVEPGRNCTPGPSCPQGQVFSVVARSTDDSGNAVVMLRARFWKQY